MTRNFGREEFDCKCGCGKNNIRQWFVDILQDIRNIYDDPMEVTSGCRCDEHNEKEGGKPNSAHLDGIAADIKIINSHDRFRLVGIALRVGVKRIGIGKSFVHLDISKSNMPEVMWLY